MEAGRVLLVQSSAALLNRPDMATMFLGSGPATPALRETT
jgi:hypothetical protein